MRNEMLAFITVVGNREHDLDGDSVIKAYSGEGVAIPRGMPICRADQGLISQRVRLGLTSPTCRRY